MDIYQVDSFANEPFKGNPAGVCVLDGPKDDRWMQQVAAEMNVAETAFLYPQEDGYSLRWFSPVAEVPLCGHATLASAHILWERGFLDPGKQARFHTRSGLLAADKRDGRIELDFPAEPAQAADCPDELKAGLGIEPKYVGRNRMDYLIEAESEEAVKNLSPDFSLLAKVKTRGIIVTSSSSTFDFISRSFFPAIGVNEDPVTGSAHCCLGPYWQSKLNRNVFQAYQASPRGGFLKVEVAGERVLISGQAITVLTGTILY